MKNKFVAIIIAMIAITSFSYAQKESPASVAAALTLKLAGFNNKLSGGVKIYVVGNDVLASELKKGVGKPLGKATLSSVDAGADVPGSKYDIIVCGSSGKAGAVSKFAKSHKALSVTNIPSILSKGISLGIGVGDDNKPKILLNLTQSSEEGIDWNPAIMKVAETVK